MEPLYLYLSFKTHLQQTCIFLVGNNINSHVLFLNREAYSSSMAIFQDETSRDLRASLKV